MTNPLRPDPEVIAIAGDWHGNLGVALAQVQRAADAGAQMIVHLGDFGYWVPDAVTRKYVIRLERKLDEFGLHLLFVDGNHEDHDRIAAKSINPATGLRTVRPHIHHLPRAFRWQWCGHTWMALGGAVSVDKQQRREGRDWWPQEVLSDADVTRAVDGGPVDVLVSHDAPAGVRIPGLRPGVWPDDVVAEADAHRALMREVVDAIRPRAVWHGHYHVRYRDVLDLGWAADRPDWTGQCVVHGLDCDQGHWANNLALVSPSGAVLRDMITSAVSPLAASGGEDCSRDPQPEK